MSSSGKSKCYVITQNKGGKNECCTGIKRNVEFRRRYEERTHIFTSQLCNTHTQYYVPQATEFLWKELVPEILTAVHVLIHTKRKAINNTFEEEKKQFHIHGVSVLYCFDTFPAGRWHAWTGRTPLHGYQLISSLPLTMSQSFVFYPIKQTSRAGRSAGWLPLLVLLDAWHRSSFSYLSPDITESSQVFFYFKCRKVKKKIFDFSAANI